MRKFNTTGPCFPDEHYMLPALDRLPGIRELVAGGNYLVIHAPRQTGKTTALKALVREINAKGDMAAIYCTLETIQKLVGSFETAMREIRHLVLKNARMVRALAPFVDEIGELKTSSGISTAVEDALQDLCFKSGKKVAVFFDEVDCLVGEVLVSFLRQLRDGYVNRDMMPFPKSVALVGMLDVRDYKALIRPDGESLGEISPFNIISEDLLIPNFTEADIRTLYAQPKVVLNVAASNAALNLDYSGRIDCAEIRVGGAKTFGTFGAAGSGAENEVAWITGTGFVRALPKGTQVIFR